MTIRADFNATLEAAILTTTSPSSSSSPSSGLLSFTTYPWKASISCNSIGLKERKKLQRKDTDECRAAAAAACRCGMVGEPAPMGSKSTYKDSRYDSFCINHLANCMSKESGFTTKLKGYDALIDIAMYLGRTRSPKQQREATLRVLQMAIPLWLPKVMQLLLRPSKLVWEFYALTTPLLFGWLIGPTEINETEVNGVRQKSVVHIKKCRYLENSNCVGTCVNLCKIPSEIFIQQYFGVDLTMVPNFEDMSCDMIYGQKPLPLEQDPAMLQPCYKTLCLNAQGKDRDCPKISSSKTIIPKDIKHDTSLV